MPFLITNPDYRDFLQRQGLTTCDDFLSLQGVVVGGHPDRHVAHVTVGAGPDAIRAFLKGSTESLGRTGLRMLFADSAWVEIGPRSSHAR